MSETPTAKSVQDEYERGKRFKTSLNLYETCRQNENFYLGKHWEGLKSRSVQPMTFNFLRRIISTAQALVVSDDIGFEIQPFLSTAERDAQGLLLEEFVRAALERQKISTLNRECLHDCVVFGDSALYFWFDADMETGQAMRGDIRAEVLLNTNIIFGNPYSNDVQRQPYIILVRRRPVQEVRKEAREQGVPDWDLISAESEGSYYLGEDQNDGGQLVTELTRLWKERGEDGRQRVRWARFCGEVQTREPTDTGMSLYPLAYWSWIDRKNCMHGVSPMTENIPTQIAINQLMTYIHVFHRNLAFPKLIYDVAKFPNGWDGTPGKAIAVRGDVNQALLNTTGGLTLPPAVTQIVELMRNMMQDCLGASDAQLGNVKPDNTSAIIAAQKASSAPLELQKRKFEQFNEDSIRILVDMMCACYGRRAAVIDQHIVDPASGQEVTQKMLGEVDFDSLDIGQLDINVNVGAASYWSELVQSTTLDQLFLNHIITDPEVYLKSVPATNIPNKNELLRSAADAKQRQQMAVN